MDLSCGLDDSGLAGATAASSTGLALALRWRDAASSMMRAAEALSGSCGVYAA
jgi:hypothetical protein